MPLTPNPIQARYIASLFYLPPPKTPNHYDQKKEIEFSELEYAILLTD